MNQQLNPHNANTKETLPLSSTNRSKPKRPDKQLYVPRARRQEPQTSGTNNPSEDSIRLKEVDNVPKNEKDGSNGDVSTNLAKTKIGSSKKRKDDCKEKRRKEKRKNCGDASKPSRQIENTLSKERDEAQSPNVLETFDPVATNVSNHVVETMPLDDVKTSTTVQSDDKLISTLAKHELVDDKKSSVVRVHVTESALPKETEENVSPQCNVSVYVPDCKNNCSVISEQVIEIDIKPSNSIGKSNRLEPMNCTEKLAKTRASTASEREKTDEEDTWETMYADDGECLNPELMEELTDSLGDVKIEHAKLDYLKFEFREPNIDSEEFGHVIEIYDFPAEFKSVDLMTAFSQFKNQGFDIKWVDDTHALGIFTTPFASVEALNITHPNFKTRPLSQASRDSKLKARRCAEFLQPYKQRPETSASLARRLVVGALGLKTRVPKEQRELERQKLREAKERRKLAAKQKNDAWEGIIETQRAS